MIRKMDLLKHQTEAVEEFVRRNGRILLWADTGTGKTAIAISAFERVPAVSAVYFCPAILKTQIASEFRKFSPDTTVTVIEGSAKERKTLWKRPADVYVANYELLLSDLDEMLELDPTMIVADECQRLNSPSAKSVKAFRRLKPKYRLAMSGTPAPNALHELWNVTDWIAPGAFHETFWQFRARECRMHPAFPKILGYFRPEKVKEKFMSVTHRIRREDAIELPPLTEVRIECELLSGQRKAYDKLKEELALELANGERLTVTNMLALIMRLRQMADMPELLGVAEESGKVKALHNLLDGISSRKILVFTEFAQVAERLAQDMRCLRVTGDVAEAERQRTFERFRTDSDRVLFLTSAAQYGVNLQAADTVIHFDLPWNDARVEQRTARAWRYGQDKPVKSYRIIAKGTVDEKMERLVESKRKATVDDLMSFFT